MMPPLASPAAARTPRPSAPQSPPRSVQLPQSSPEISLARGTSLESGDWSPDTKCSVNRIRVSKDLSGAAGSPSGHQPAPPRTTDCEERSGHQHECRAEQQPVELGRQQEGHSVLQPRELLKRV